MIEAIVIRADLYLKIFALIAALFSVFFFIDGRYAHLSWSRNVHAAQDMDIREHEIAFEQSLNATRIDILEDRLERLSEQNKPSREEKLKRQLQRLESRQHLLEEQWMMVKKGK